jgi:hypothetical protein
LLLHDFLVAAAVGQLGDLTRQSAGRRRSWWSLSFDSEDKNARTLRHE